MRSSIVTSIPLPRPRRTRPPTHNKLRSSSHLSAFPASCRPNPPLPHPAVLAPYVRPLLHHCGELSTMPSQQPLTDLSTHSFPNADAFSAFLEANHLTSPGIYLKLAKKASGIPSIAASQAVETALCFGWIDGRANSIDDEWWTVRYTPRRPKSMWSQKNVATVGRLMEEGKMRDAGLGAVEAAKKDGRWDAAYAGPATIAVPEDLARALEGEPEAKRFFEGMNKSDRYAVLWRVQTASVKARAKRIEALVEMLREGKSPHVPAKAETSVRKGAVEKKKVKKTTTTKAKVVRKERAKAKATPDIPPRQSRRAGLRSRP